MILRDKGNMVFPLERVLLKCLFPVFKVYFREREREKDLLNSVDIFSLQGAFEIPLVFSENFLLRNLFWAAGERPFDKASLYP